MNKVKRLEDKVIVVSGGTKGIGRTAVEEFAREGAKVIIGGRDEDAAKKSIKIIKAMGGEASFVKTDLRDVEQCNALFSTAYENYKRLDGFFNYAGVTPISSLEDCTEELFDEIMDVNFKAAFFCCKNAIKYMKMSGGGSIVFAGSVHAWGGEKDRAGYACSKGALLTLMNHIAHNYAADNIRSNYLTLGWIPTEGEVALRNSMGMSESELRKKASKMIPMGRMQERIDYVGALVYMMSDESSMMTGSDFKITGGLYL